MNKKTALGKIIGGFCVQHLYTERRFDDDIAFPIEDSIRVGFMSA